MVSMYEMLFRHKKNYALQLSRLFVYYNSRRLGATESIDSGAYLDDVIQAVLLHGICAEILWPYNIENFAVRPDVNSYEDGLKRNIKDYYRLSSLSDMLDALNNNRLVLFGFETFENFITLDAPYTVDMPPADAVSDGAHAMFLVGYDLEQGLLLAKNSFGSDWGNGGYCWISFDYAESYFVDMWTFDVAVTY